MATKELILLLKARDEASKTLKGFGDNVSSAAATVVKFGAVGVAAMGALAGAAVNAAADFEKSMSGIKAVSGATGAEMKQLTDLTLQLGKDTVFSAGEAAAGIEELIKGGVAITDVLGGSAKAMLDLAAAGGVSLPEAAEIASNAMAMFGLKGKDMAHVADQIAGAANASSLSVGDFRLSMAAAGAVAAASGQTFDDLATAIAIMGKAGIKGSDAGTSLKTMLMSLQPTTAKAMAAFEELGIITKDGTNQFINANGSFKSMAEIAGVLQKATAGLTDAEKMLKLEVMFGSDAIRAGAILAKEGAAGFDAMAGAMGKVTAASVAATKLDNMKGSLEQLKGSLETLAIIAGTALIPLLRPLIDWATKAVNAAMPMVEQFGKELPGAIDRMKKAIQSVAGDVKAFVDDWARFLGDSKEVTRVLKDHSGTLTVLGGVITGIATALGLMRAAQIAHTAAVTIATTVTNGLAVAQGILNVIMTANPIGLVIVALAALGAAFVIAWNTNAEFRTKVTEIWGAIASTVQGAINGIIGSINGLLTAWNKLELTLPRIEIPDWVLGIGGQVWGGNTISTPDVGMLPYVDMGLGKGGNSAPMKGAFAQGGIVPGPLGSPGWAVVHGGERVQTRAQQQAGGDTYNITVNTAATSGTYLADIEMARSLAGA